jgi:hypothetical protein
VWDAAIIGEESHACHSDRAVSVRRCGAPDQLAGQPRPVAEGAASVVWAVTLPDDGPSGGFFRDGEPLGW